MGRTVFLFGVLVLAAMHSVPGAKAAGGVCHSASRIASLDSVFVLPSVLRDKSTLYRDSASWSLAPWSQASSSNQPVDERQQPNESKPSGRDEFQFGPSYRSSNSLKVYNLLKLDFVHFYGGGPWGLRLGWSLLEWWRVDSTSYLSSTLFFSGPPPRTTKIALVFLESLITPDITLEREISRRISASVFVGLDVLPGWTNIWDYEGFRRGMLLSPRTGAQFGVWRFRIRLFTSQNHWWIFRGPDKDLGRTLGFDFFYTVAEGAHLKGDTR